ncbi:MAG: helix-turn-helix domain-containing protein [Firmicutes bacterium]|nr:helix-turn-helix domain-containing protein [Bacillota bacterium]
MIILERILKLIEENQITAYKLTSDCGLSNSAVSDWKSNKAKPGTDAVVKLAKYFNVSTDYLLGLTENPKPHY